MVIIYYIIQAAENGHTDTVDILISSEPKASGVTDFKGRKPIDVVKNEEARCKLQPCDWIAIVYFYH